MSSKVLTYDELQAKYADLVARLNKTEDLRKVIFNYNCKQ